MPFLTKIQVARIAGDSGDWELISDLVYEGKIDKFIIPKGFHTDFASIPRLLAWLIPKNGKHDAAAILHDWLYREQPTVSCFNETGDPHPITRKQADQLFRRMMHELGVNPIRYQLMYIVVRLTGWYSWYKSRMRLND